MFLSFLFVWNISWLVICVSLIVKWVSGKQHVIGCCFIIQSAIICLLTRVLSPLIFKVIFHKYAFIAILNIFSSCFCISSFFLSFSASFLFCGLWFSFKLCFSSLLFGFSESVACILFVVTLIFNHVNPLLYLLSLNWESNKLKHIQKKILHFLPPFPNILWFWCPILHLYICYLAIYCSYNCLHKFGFFFPLFCVLAYLSDLQSIHTFAFPIVTFFSLYILASFLCKQNPSTFLLW